MEVSIGIVKGVIQGPTKAEQQHVHGKLQTYYDTYSSNNLLLLWQQWMAPEEEDVKLSVAVLRHITSSCLSFYNSFTTSLIPGVNSATKWTMVAVDIHKIPFYGSNTDLEESADVCGRSMLRLNCELLCNLDQ